jgi:cytochrome P450
MASIAARHLDRWPANAPIRVLSRMRTIVEEVFVRLVLGVEDDERATALVNALGRLLRTPGNPPLLPPDRHQGTAGRLVDLAFKRRLAPLARLLSEEVEACRTAPGSGTGIIPHIVSADRSLDNQQIVDELAVVLAAAQEPPAIALTWIVERLSRDRELADRFLAAEHGSPARDAIANETLRLRPPALACLRRLTVETTAAGHQLQPGTDVMVPIPLVHRDPVAFDDPHSFRDDRFLDSAPPAAFIPFGDGIRGCPGQDLAAAEIRTIVPLVLERVRLRFPARPERPVQRATVLVPNRSGLAIASRNR